MGSAFAIGSAFVIGSAFAIGMALAFGCAPWALRSMSRTALAAATALALVAAVVGVILAPHLAPVADFLVASLALSAGVLLGRTVPPRPMPLLVLLTSLSVLDIVQIVLFEGGAPGGGTSCGLYGSFCVVLPWGTYSVGIFDLLLIALMAEHWRRRGANVVLGAAPGVVGFAAVQAYGHLLPDANLPLVPFLTVGWLASQGWWQLRAGRSSRYSHPET